MKSLQLRVREIQSLAVIEIAKLILDFPVAKGKLTFVPQLQSAISIKPQIISCGGYNADVLKALNQDPSRQGGIQYPFRSERVDVKKLVRGPS